MFQQKDKNKTTFPSSTDMSITGSVSATITFWRISVANPKTFPTCLYLLPIVSCKFNHCASSNPNGFITGSRFVLSLGAGLSNRICLIAYNSPIHISASPQSTKISTNEPLWENNELPAATQLRLFWMRVDRVWRLSKLQIPVTTGVMASDSELIPPV